MANYSQNYVFSGLGSLSFNVPTTSAYFFDGKISLPTIVGGAGVSAVVVTINQNGAPVYVGTAGAEGFRADFACTANDLIAIVLSSANANDNALNAVKMTVAIGEGV